MTFNNTIFKCHQWSQIVEDTVKPSCLSKKLISKYATSNLEPHYQSDQDSNSGQTSNLLKYSMHFAAKLQRQALLCITSHNKAAFRTNCVQVTEAVSDRNVVHWV